MLDTKTIQSSASQLSKAEKTKAESRSVAPRMLLWHQVGIRLDLGIRDYAIGEILGENDFGIGLWKKLGGRSSIPFDRRLARLTFLINSFEENGYLETRPFKVDRYWQLRGHSHRLLLCLRHDVSNVKVLRCKNLLYSHNTSFYSGCYNNYLLRRLEYTDEEINLAWRGTYELFRIAECPERVIEEEG